MLFYEKPKPIKELTNEEIAQVVTEATRNFHYFCEVILGYDDMNEEHKLLCMFLQHGRLRKKLVLTPRYTFKSCICTIGLSLWKIINDPDIRILIYSDSEKKAVGFLKGIKNHMVGSYGKSRFREFFGEYCGKRSHGEWSEHGIIVRLREKASVEPTVDTAGIDVSKVGMHYDFQIYDDIVSKVNVSSKQQLDKVFDCYNESMALLKPKGDVVLVGCLTEDSLVMMHDGTQKKIISVNVGDKVRTIKNWRIYNETVEAMIPQGEADVFELKTFNHTIEATSNHPFLTIKNQFKQLKDLKVGDKIISSSFNNVGLNTNLSVEDLYILGFWLGDGWITKHPNSKGSMRAVSCFAKGIYPEINERVLNILEKKHNWKFKETKFGYYKTEKASVARYLLRLGFSGNAKTKRIPEYVFSLKHEFKESILMGILDSDGHYGDQKSIELCNENLIKDIKLLAESCGYRVSNIHYRKRIAQAPHSKQPIVSEQWHITIGLRKKFKPFQIDQIQSIKYVGKKKVFDLTVSNTHNFVANGLFVHNTRWHFNDTYGRIIDKNKDVEDFGIFIRDAEITDINGKLIYENIGLDREHLDSLKASMGEYTYACLMRNRPVASDTALFPENGFQFYGSLQESEEPLRTGKYDYLYCTLTLDPAGEGADMTGGIVVGTDFQMKMYILDVVNRRMTTEQMIEWIFKMNSLYKLRMIGVETNLFQGLLEKEIYRRMKIEQSGNPTFNMFGIKQFRPSSGRGESKFLRISSLQPYFQRGEILFPGKSLNTLKREIGDLAYQMLQVTPTHMPEPNDAVDALAYQIDLIRPGGVIKKEIIKKDTPLWLESQMIKQHNEKQKRLPKRLRKMWKASLS